MQLDKTIRYNPTLPIAKGYYYTRRTETKLSFVERVKLQLKHVVDRIKSATSSELGIVRLIIVTTSLACFIFSVMGTDEYYYRTINLAQCFFGICFIGFSFMELGKANSRKLGNAYIYMLDVSNILLVATSHFVDKLSYQYIIYFFVSSLFFNNKKSLRACIVLNCALVFGFALLPSENSSSTTDFYTVFIASAFALYVLMMKRFSMEGQLAENESKYRLLAENSADVICTHKSSGEFDFVSPSIFHLTGYHPHELKGFNVKQFIHPKDRVSYFRGLSSSREAATDEAFQYRFKAKNGKYIWLETVVRKMKNADSSEKMFLSQTRSFQHHHEFQEQIRRHSAELQSSYKDLEMFAYISSHDMQEPLRMISNYMQLLRRKYSTQLDKDAMEYIEYATKGASNLQALIKDLLSYSTINKKEINLCPVDMDDVLDDVLSGLQLLMEEKNAKVYITEPLRPMMGDKNAILQLTQNLIQNGIKYNTSEMPVIKISSTEDAKSVIYCVEDNGIGIEPQYARQIFEPFKRLHNKHNFPGTGLGLSICRKIIDRLNGNIWVESKPGEGSSFYFSLPKSDVAQGETTNAERLTEACA